MGACSSKRQNDQHNLEEVKKVKKVDIEIKKEEDMIGYAPSAAAVNNSLNLYDQMK